MLSLYVTAAVGGILVAGILYILAGRFSPHEARDLVWLLQAGMRPPAKGDRKDTKK